MRVAVLMSTYNGEKYLKQQIDSILNQRGDFQLDLLIRDDGSNDNTISILEEYTQTNKIHYYIGNNLGPAYSFLDLLINSHNYDFYAFADQDDYWMPNKISVAISNLSNIKGPALYFANAELVDSNLNSVGRNVYKKTPSLDLESLSCAGGVLGCTMIINAELALAIQTKRKPHNVIMHDFYINELCLALNGTILYDPIPQIKYRQHDSNVIGVSYRKLHTFKKRYYDIISKPPISVSEQAKEIINLYKNELNNEKIAWLIKIAKYHNNLFSRIALACSMKTKYINKNMGLKIRLSILLGNR